MMVIFLMEMGAVLFASRNVVTVRLSLVKFVTKEAKIPIQFLELAERIASGLFVVMVLRILERNATMEQI